MKFNAPPHYQAPIAGLAISLIVFGLRYLDGAGLFRIRGSHLLRALIALSFLGFLWGIGESTLNARKTRNSDRFQSELLIEAVPGEHLVLVRFGPRMGNGDEWLFNMADLENSRIIWARDSSPQARKALLDYYPNRKVWILRRGFGHAHPRPVLIDRNEAYDSRDQMVMESSHAEE